jgi:hypothetical protein
VQTVLPEGQLLGFTAGGIGSLYPVGFSILFQPRAGLPQRREARHILPDPTSGSRIQYGGSVAIAEALISLIARTESGGRVLYVNVTEIRFYFEGRVEMGKCRIDGVKFAF